MTNITISVDAMGGDSAPEIVLDGLALFCKERSNVRFLVHGKSGEVEAGAKARGFADRCTFIDQPEVVSMSAKPSSALRRAKGTSLERRKLVSQQAIRALSWRCRWSLSGKWMAFIVPQ